VSDVRITRRAGVAAPHRDPTADEIFRVPSVEEVAAAGYHDPVAFQESIRIRYAECKKRFETDAAYRIEVIAEYNAMRARDAREKVGR
jgi:hypothetical protein